MKGTVSKKLRIILIGVVAVILCSAVALIMLNSTNKNHGSIANLESVEKAQKEDKDNTWFKTISKLPTTKTLNPNSVTIQQGNLTARVNTDLGIESSIANYREYYGIGETVEITAQFDQIIQSCSNSKLIIKFGNGGEKQVSGTVDGSTIKFTYKIAQGDMGELQVIALSGTVTDNGNNSIEMGLPTNGLQYTTSRTIIADGTRPTATSTISNDGTTITGTFTFSENIYGITDNKIANASNNNIDISMTIGDYAPKGNFNVSYGANTITITYKIVKGDNGIPKFTIKNVCDIAGNKDIFTGEGTGASISTEYTPKVTSISSVTTENGREIDGITYLKAGCKVVVTVNYNDNVYSNSSKGTLDADSGKINLEIINGSASVTKQAKVRSVSGSTVVYEYEIENGLNGKIKKITVPAGIVYDNVGHALRDEYVYPGVEEITNIQNISKEIESTYNNSVGTAIGTNKSYSYTDASGREQAFSVDKIIDHINEVKSFCSSADSFETSQNASVMNSLIDELKGEIRTVIENTNKALEDEYEYIDTLEEKLNTAKSEKENNEKSKEEKERLKAEKEDAKKRLDEELARLNESLNSDTGSPSRQELEEKIQKATKDAEKVQKEITELDEEITRLSGEINNQQGKIQEYTNELREEEEKYNKISDYNSVINEFKAKVEDYSSQLSSNLEKITTKLTTLENIIIDTTAPVITSISKAENAQDGIYGQGSTLDFTVAFSESVNLLGQMDRYFNESPDVVYSYLGKSHEDSWNTSTKYNVTVMENENGLLTIHCLEGAFEDKAGNTTAEKTQELTYIYADTTAPELTITSDPSGLTKNNTITYNFNLTDNSDKWTNVPNRGIAANVLGLGNITVTNGTIIDNSSTNGNINSITVLADNDGKQRVYVKATIKDVALNNANSTLVNQLYDNVVIDNKGPVITNIEKSENNWTNNDVTLTVYATDEYADVTKYSYDNGSSWETSNTKTYSENTSNIQIKTQDSLGNTSTSQNVSITNIDKELPKITNLTQTANNDVSSVITFNAVDTVSGIEKVEINGTQVTLDEDGNCACIVTENGWYTVSVTDKAGNTVTDSIEVTNIVKIKDEDASIIFEKNGGTYKLNKEGRALIEDNIIVTNVAISKIEYAWTTSKDEPSAYTQDGGNSTALKAQYIAQELDTYYLHVKTTDTKGHITTACSNEYIVDGRTIGLDESLVVKTENNVDYLILSEPMEAETLLEKIEGTNVEIKNSDLTQNVTGNLKTGDNIVTDGDVQYVIVLKGDVNSDGKIDLKDIFALNNYRLNILKLTVANWLAADVTEDRTINLKDIYKINNYRLGIIESL